MLLVRTLERRDRRRKRGWERTKVWSLSRSSLHSVLRGKFVSFVGAGGKTSSIEYLASWLVARGKSVCITTTTKIYAKEPFTLFPERIRSAPFLRVGKDLCQGKLTGLSYEEVENLGRYFDFVLVEADGAKGMPLKCPRDGEPLIPPFSDMVIIVAGLDALGFPIKEKVLRWELFCEKKGVQPDATLVEDRFLSFFDRDMLLKDVQEGKGLVLLNRYDLLRNRRGALDLAKGICRRTGMKVLVGTVLFGFFYLIEERNGG